MVEENEIDIIYRYIWLYIYIYIYMNMWVCVSPSSTNTETKIPSIDALAYKIFGQQIGGLHCDHSYDLKLGELDLLRWAHGANLVKYMTIFEAMCRIKWT